MKIASEREVAGIAAMIAGLASLTPVEKNLRRGEKPDISLANAARGLIKAGSDPLGEAFEQLRAPETRRALGAVYTPASLVDAMIDWADATATPDRVVDPGAGSGRYIAAAAHKWPRAVLVACEIDPLAALVLRANATALGFAHRLQLFIGDYREMDLPQIRGKTLFVGNPPYVRHHQIDRRWKRWFTETAQELGFGASQLAGLHAHFFLRTKQLARRGDFGCFVTSSEWLDVGYGVTIREMLGNGLGGASLHVVDAGLMPFGTTMTTAAITCFQVGRKTPTMGVQSIEAEKDLRRLTSDSSVEWRDLLAAKRWSIIVKQRPSKPTGAIEIGELFRVKRGLVTGCNEVWAEGSYPGPLPSACLLPTVTKGREIVEAGGRLVGRGLRRVVFLPKKLETLASYEQGWVDDFLRWARLRGADKTFTARSRTPWWHIGLREPPAILATYMGRRQPSFALNSAKAQYLNIALGLYPREDLCEADLVATVRHLQSNVCTSLGRTYAGGLVKFEPSELEAVPIPTLKEMRALQTNQPTA